MYDNGYGDAFLTALVVWILGLVILFFIIRYAVRANEQISLLKEINKKQNTQIELLTSLVHKEDRQ